MGLGCIPLARYGTPGTSELAQTLEPYVPNYDAILMSNHGVVTYGDTLERAYMKMETVEHFAEIALVTHLLGRQQPLKQGEIEKLISPEQNTLVQRTQRQCLCPPRQGRWVRNRAGS